MPVEAPNTLRSRARYKIVDVLSQGPIKGLVNGAKSVFLDETPIQAIDGTLNFKNFQISTDLQQLPIPDISGQLIKNNPALFPLSENEVSVGVKVTKDSPAGSGSGDGSVTRSITDTNVDSVRVTLRVPALTTTNTTTGDITGGKIRFNIYVKPDGGAFMPISSGAEWQTLTNPTDETSDGATGIAQTVVYPGVYTYAFSATWQYAKKTGGSWGSWITYDTVTIPAASPSTDNRGYYNNYGEERAFTRSINGLEPGIYKAQVVTSPSFVAATQTQQFIERAIEIDGKTTSPYDADYIVQLPGTGPWDIKVSRVSADPATANIQADLYWLSYTEQVSNRFSWPNIAGTVISFDAEDFGGNIPTRSYDVMGLIVKVPANYDSYNRTYTGIWNGTFKDDWTDNPAWIFYDLLTNKRYGLGDNIDAAQIDKYALYQIAQYCDELVDAPNGEQEPRYTCSCVINSQSEAYELLTAIASAFRGMIYLAGGTITPTADMPSDPILNVGPANVIDGLFTYQGASRKSRHSVARVSWNNPDDGYKLNVELYEDTEAIRKYGYRPIDINAFGCTSRGLARRWGKWSVVSDNDAPDTVTYKAGFDHFKLRPGDVVNIADPNYSGEQLFGLIVDVVDNVSPATHTITLDRAVTRLAGDTSELQLTLADGTILALDVAVLSNTTSSEITVDSSELTTIPLAGASWLLKKGTVEPRQWRVISISEDEPNIYQVTAMLYDPNKYDKVESDLNFAEADFTAFPDGPMAAPTGLVTSEFLKQTGSAILACVNLSWTRPNDPRADWFEVQYQLDGEEWRVTEPNLTQFTGIDIINIVPGTYNFRVRAQDTSGLFRSAWATLASQTLSGKDKKPEDVTGFTAAIEKYGVLMSWNPVSDIDIDYYEIRRGASWAAGTFVSRVKGTVYKWEDATEAAYTFWIKALDTQTPANESVNAASAAATVAVEATPSVVGTTAKSGISVAISGTTTNRFAHYELQRKKTTDADGDAVTVNALLASREFTDTLVAAIGYTPLYQYRARAVNKNLNPSAWSDWSTGVNPGQITGDDIVNGALNRSDLFVSGVVNATAIANGAVTAIKTTLAAIDSTTGNLNANTVNALQINAGAVTTEKLYALAVTAAKIAGGAVTTEKLLVGAPGSALNDDPGFQDVSAWAYNFGGLPTITTVTDGVAGNGVARSPSGLQAWFNSTRAIPLDQSKALRFRFWARRSADADGTLYGVVALFDSAGVNIEGAGSQWYYAPSAVIPNTTWAEYAAIVPAYSYPANARFIRPGAILNYSGTAGYMEIQDLRLEEVLPATLIQDGAIITDKLAANAVTAAKITAGAVETAKLAANAVTADKVDATVVKTTELNVYGKNRCPDPAFDGVPYTADYFSHGTLNGLAIGAWTGTSNGSASAASLHKNGTTYPILNWVKVPGSNAVAIIAEPYSTGFLSSKIIPVKANGPYAVSASITASSSGPKCAVWLIWYDASRNYISSSKCVDVTPSFGASPAIYSGTANAPSTAAYAVVRIATEASGNFPVAAYFGAIQLEEGTTATAWVNREQGTVTADRVVTGQIKSLNYSTTAGSLIDLDSGDIKMGGSSAPRFSFTNSTNTGVFAGFTFNATDMTAGSGSTAIGISTDTAKKAFWAGNSTPASAPFYIAHDGTGKMAGFVYTTGVMSISNTVGYTTESMDIDNSTGIGILRTKTAYTEPSFNYEKTIEVKAGKIFADLDHYTAAYDCSAILNNGYGTGTSDAFLQITMSSDDYYALSIPLGRAYCHYGWLSTSDESVKSDIEDINVLDDLKSIRVKQYRIDEEKSKERAAELAIEASLRNNNTIDLSKKINLDSFDIPEYRPVKKSIGVFAEEFNTIFGVCGENKRLVNANDLAGVALRAAQELAEITDKHNAEISELKSEIEELKAALKELTKLIKKESK